MIRSGFFNATNHDKQYYASDISRLFNALVNDGIFENIGNHFSPRPGAGMQVIIGAGMSYINSTWTLNDSDHVVNIDEAPYVSGYKRIDGIFIRSYNVNNVTTKDNDIYYMKGTETSDTPTAPVPEQTEDEVYTPLCYVTVTNGDTEITAASIRNVIGLSDSPYITGILQTVDISELFNQWSAQWNAWIGMQTRNFNTWNEGMLNDFVEWFNQIKGILSEDAAGNLQNEIDDINTTIASIRSQQAAHNTKITALEDSLKDLDNDWYEFDVISGVTTRNASYRYLWNGSQPEKYTGYRNALEGREELLVTLVDGSDVIYGMQKITSPVSNTKGFSVTFRADYPSANNQSFKCEILLRILKDPDYIDALTYPLHVDSTFPSTLHIKVYRHRKYKPAD